MSTAPSVEDRLSALERQMEELQQKLDQNGKQKWIEKITGSFAGDPDFGEILRLGREARKADRLLDDE